MFSRKAVSQHIKYRNAFFEVPHIVSFSLLNLFVSPALSVVYFSKHCDKVFDRVHDRGLGNTDLNQNINFLEIFSVPKFK
jgi:hypothetical protein